MTIELKSLIQPIFQSNSSDPSFFYVSKVGGSEEADWIREVLKLVPDQPKNFLSGRFQEDKQDYPFFGILPLFDELFKNLENDPDKAESSKPKILQALRGNGQCLQVIFPNLTEHFGEQPELHPLQPKEAIYRFKHVFESFLGEIASLMNPLIILLDDLQWADVSSLDILQMIVDAPDSFRIKLVLGVDQGFYESATTSGHPIFNDPKFKKVLLGSVCSEALEEKTIEPNPNLSKDQHHYQRGIDLLSSIGESPTIDVMFDTLYHLNRCIDLVATPEEQIKIAQLNLDAAHYLLGIQAQASAIQHLEKGLLLLEHSQSDSAQLLRFQLKKTLAKTQYLVSDYDSVSRLCSELYEITSSDQEKFDIYLIEIESFMAQGKYTKAIELSSAALAIEGIVVPRSRADSTFRFLNELDSFPNYRRERDILALLNEPSLAGEKIGNQLHLLHHLAVCADHLFQPQLVTWIAVKRVNLCLHHGHGDAASLSYMRYASDVLAQRMNDYQGAIQYGKMALSLADKFGNPSVIGQTYFLFATFLDHWKSPIASILENLQIAIDASQDGGNVTYSSFAITNLLLSQIMSGIPLSKVIDEVRIHRPFLKHYAPDDYDGIVNVAILNPLVQLIGDSHLPPTLEEEVAERRKPLKFPHAPYFMAHHYAAQLRSLFLLGSYNEALEYLNKSDFVGSVGAQQAIIPEFSFYSALTLSAILRQPRSMVQDVFESSEPQLTPEERDQMRQLFKAQLSKMEYWAAEGPPNYKYKFFLLEAEGQRMWGQAAEAPDFYDMAITTANENQYLQGEAIGHELMGSYWQDIGNLELGKKHISLAKFLFQKWGAIAVVDRISEQYADLLTP